MCRVARDEAVAGSFVRRDVRRNPGVDGGADTS